MSIRDAINKNPAVGIVLVVVIVAIVILILRGNGPAGDNPLTYYYDLQSGALYTALKTDVPPITAPSGAGNGVQAAVFACGGCDSADNQFVGWLSKFDPEVHDLVHRLNESVDALDANGNPIDVMAVDAHAYVAAPPAEPGGEIEWIPLTSPQAQALRELPFTRCPEGVTVATCYPSE